MPRPKTGLDDPNVRKVLELRSLGKSFREIGRELNLSHTVCAKYWRRFSHKGKDPLPEFTQKAGGPQMELDQVDDSSEIDGSVQVLKRDRILTPDELKAAAQLGDDWIAQYYQPNFWEGFIKIKTNEPKEFDTQKVRLFQSKATFKRIIGEELRNAILDFCGKNIQPLPAPRLKKAKKDDRPPYVVAWGLWDAHLGMYAWRDEVGEDYDVAIAKRRIMNSIDDMVEELSLYNISKIWMPLGNDFMHFDNVRKTTSGGDHLLDVDSRFGKVYDAGVECLVYAVERALDICDCVDGFFIPGNHDHFTAFTLCAMLRERFHNDPRVSIDIKSSPSKVRVHGGTVVIFDHGKDTKPGQWPLTFSEAAKEHMSTCTYKEVQIGHKHQRRVTKYEAEVPTNGVHIRVNPALSNVDFWHQSQQLIGEPQKSVEAWRYDETGYRGSHVVWARDDKRS
jgi:hypothetical protein